MPLGRKLDDRQEWVDLRALQKYACVSERTLRSWIHRASDPLPASQVGTKIFVRRSAFDYWMESHEVKHVDVNGIVEDVLKEFTGRASE
jgi:hypothetical protein